MNRIEKMMAKVEEKNDALNKKIYEHKNLWYTTSIMIVPVLIFHFLIAELLSKTDFKQIISDIFLFSCTMIIFSSSIVFMASTNPSTSKEKVNSFSLFKDLVRIVLWVILISISVSAILNFDDGYKMGVSICSWSIIFSKVFLSFFQKIKSLIVDNKRSIENIKLINTLIISFVTVLSTILAILLTVKNLIE